MSKEEPLDRRVIGSYTRQRIGPWYVAMGWPEGKDQGGPVEISISPHKDATDDEVMAGLSSTWLRQIDFQKARQEWMAKGANPTDPAELARGIKWRSEKLQRTLGRDGVTDVYLAQLAEAYTLLAQEGDRSVAAKLAEMTGRSPDTMKQHLHRVRKEGMLTSIPGKVGGVLTQKAWDVLRAAADS